MFTQKARKTIAWLVAAMVCMACMGMVAVAEQNDSGADVPANPTEQATNATVPAQEQLDLVEIDDTQSGDEAQTQPVEALPLPEEAVYLVTFYDLFGEVVGWADVPEGAYLLEMDGYPHVDGLVFEYWFDPSLEEVVPYVFGTPIYNSFDLVPFYTIAPEGEDTGAPKTGVYPELNDEQQVINMVEEILNAADEDSPNRGTYAPKQQVINDGSIDKESLLTGILGAGMGQTQEKTETPEQTESATNVGEDTLFLLLDGDGAGEMSALDLSSEGETLPEEDLGESILDIENIEPAIQPEENTQADNDVTLTEDAVVPEDGDAQMPQATEPAQVNPVSDNMVLVMCFFEGESIELGEPVTLAAQLINFPEDAEVTYQWQNNINGTYEDVPGATGPDYTFIADEQNVRCGWQVRTRY